MRRRGTSDHGAAQSKAQLLAGRALRGSPASGPGPEPLLLPAAPAAPRAPLAARRAAGSGPRAHLGYRRGSTAWRRLGPCLASASRRAPGAPRAQPGGGGVGGDSPASLGRGSRSGPGSAERAGGHSAGAGTRRRPAPPTAARPRPRRHGPRATLRRHGGGGSGSEGAVARRHRGWRKAEGSVGTAQSGGRSRPARDECREERLACAAVVGAGVGCAGSAPVSLSLAVQGPVHGLCRWEGLRVSGQALLPCIVKLVKAAGSLSGLCCRILY